MFLPLLESGHAFGVGREPHIRCVRRCFLLGFKTDHFFERVFPTGLQPPLDRRGNGRRAGKPWPRDFEDKIRILSLGRQPIIGGVKTGWFNHGRGPPADRGIVRQILQPESPQLFANMPLDWVSVLVQCLQVAEYPKQTVPSHADCFAVHEHTSKCRL